MRATIRIARRDAGRARGRTILVLLLIGLPIMAVTALAVVDASGEPLPATVADRAFGAEGEARITWIGLADIKQAPSLREWSAQDEAPARTLLEIERDLAAALPRAATLEREFPATVGPSDVPEPYSDTPWTWRVMTAPVAWSDVLAVNDVGATVLSRAVLMAPPADGDVPYYASQAVGLQDAGNRSLVMIAALAVFVTFEVVLLIGPAFSIGTRRTERQLALVAASGGEQRTLRQIVLMGGVLLGLAGAVFGAGAGVLIVVAVRWYLRLKDPMIMPDLQMPIPTLGAIIAIGVVLSTLAAWFPARRAGAIDVVAALAGRPTRTRRTGRTPVVAVLLILVGLVSAVFGAVLGKPAAMAGIALILAGLVMAGGEIVSVLGHLAPRLGPSARYAVRDASRQRSRTAPAIAAVMAGIAAVVGAGVYIESSTAQKNAAHLPLGPLGSVVVSYNGAVNGDDERSLRDPGLQREIAEALRANLPITETMVINVAAVDSGQVSAETYSAVMAGDRYVSADAVMDPAVVCPAYRADAPQEMSPEEFAADTRCQASGTRWVIQSWGDGVGQSSMIVDDGTLMRALKMADSEVAAQALAAGTVIVTNPKSIWPDGMVHLELGVSEATGEASSPHEVIAPGLLLDLDWHYVGAIVPPELLTGTGLAPQGTAILGIGDEVVSEASQAPAAAVVSGIDPALTLQVERGYVDGNAYLSLILVGLGAVVALGATGISVALNAAEARADLATLGAIGASPRTRRRVAGAGALLVAGIGAGLGTAGGVAFAWILVLFERHREGTVNLDWALHVPLPAVASIALLIPLVAALGGFTMTRSRLPMTRRIDL